MRRLLIASLLGLLLATPAAARGIDTYAVAVTTTGSDGSASGSANSPVINGFVEAIFLDYGSATASTDVTIAYKTRGGNILAVSNNVTDGMYVPHAKPVDNANAAITDGHHPFVVNDRLTISVAQSTALAPAVTAYIYVNSGNK